MYLRSVRIENYRAIREGFVSLNETTVLIGENDCGRSSVLEALNLVLGAPGDLFETRLKALHFHRRPDGTTGPLRVILHIVEETPGSWNLPRSIEHCFPLTPGRKREMDFEFRAALDGPANQISHNFHFRPAPSGALLECGDDVLEWVRQLIPVLWLRSGLLPQAAGPEMAESANRDPVLDALELHYWNLVSGNTRDLAAEIESGTRAARAVMDKYPQTFAGAVPMMSAMASEILNRSQTAASVIEPQSRNAAHKIGVLLLFGAVLQLVHRSIDRQGKPILIIENPESNLHPMTLATVWRMIERLAWQKIVATNSGTLLSNAPLRAIRRLTRSNGIVSEWSVRPRLLSRDDLRRVSYHLRSRRASAMFAKCWLLVEGETEYWIIPELARICGFDFAAEGVACVEFAQCGLPPLAKLADGLGIAWHVLVDGDDAGQRYADAARTLVGTRPSQERIAKVTRLRERDIEHCFWQSGFADVIQRVAYPGLEARSGPAGFMIRKAIERTSKPFLALSLIDAVAGRGPKSVPAALRGMIQSCITLAQLSSQARSVGRLPPSAID